ncbi:vitamin K epoxide reductase family protein [Actinoplanes teichomyceticus]|uniref:Putative membrane protein n=1 Tax=Actinoplanes teichomyceticus TaxID=1867 RepID=A0A561VLK4_ACTTI|nr:vitamin K epoxide reductase family protein [Actinoplanes teichomyceticus]TWG12495.1 putative membrane protein [Actinoplanes teichomyceticus]GIF13860.1 membrane protein [Actinoplanes teichomyceticus]
MSTPLAVVRRVRHSNTWIFGTMLFSACLSLLASFVLSVDAIRLAEDPDTALSCNINSVISCGTVALSWQAQLFGFPNAFLGLVAEPVVITLAVAALGGVRFPRWFMCAAQTVYTLGVIFAYWLFYQAMFHIGALCPWCLLVTVSTTLVFATLTHVNIRDGNLPLPARMRPALKSAIEADLDAVAVTIWLLALALLVLTRYGTQLFA